MGAGASSSNRIFPQPHNSNSSNDNSASAITPKSYINRRYPSFNFLGRMNSLTGTLNLNNSGNFNNLNRSFVSKNIMMEDDSNSNGISELVSIYHNTTKSQKFREENNYFNEIINEKLNELIIKNNENENEIKEIKIIDTELDE